MKALKGNETKKEMKELKENEIETETNQIKMNESKRDTYSRCRLDLEIRGNSLQEDKLT